MYGSTPARLATPASLPVVIQWLAEALPLTHFLRLVRGIMLRGAGLFELWRDVLALDRVGLRDNFFDELTSWADARSVVYAGNRAVLGTRYRECPHRVYLQPLGINERRQAAELEPDQVGLYIATFRDMSMEQSVISRAFWGIARRSLSRCGR